MTEPSAIPLCRLEELGDPGSRGFELEGLSLFLVQKDGVVRAYRNSCPHTGAPLNWQPDQFLDFDEALIQCSLHMALFDIPSGKCLAGPCLGQGLSPLPIEIKGDQIVLLHEQIYCR